MGTGFCNFNRLGWDTQTLLSLPLFQEQHTLVHSEMGCLWSETQPLQIVRCERPEENYNQVTKESPSGSSDSTSEGQRPQGGPT